MGNTICKATNILFFIDPSESLSHPNPSPKRLSRIPLKSASPVPKPSLTCYSIPPQARSAIFEILNTLTNALRRGDGPGILPNRAPILLFYLTGNFGNPQQNALLSIMFSGDPPRTTIKSLLLRSLRLSTVAMAPARLGPEANTLEHGDDIPGPFLHIYEPCYIAQSFEEVLAKLCHAGELREVTVRVNQKVLARLECYAAFWASGKWEDVGLKERELITRSIELDLEGIIGSVVERRE